MLGVLLLPITLPLRIVRATAEISFGLARGVIDAVTADEQREVADDVYAAAAPAPPEAPPPPAVVDEDELVAESGPERAPGPEIHVQEPWEGYDAMALDEVLARLEAASEAEIAIVRLYERQHENRQAVLLATGEQP
jgi:hypothetical protein